MKKRSRRLTAALTAALFFAAFLTACGPSGSSEPPEPPASSESEPSSGGEETPAAFSYPDGADSLVWKVSGDWIPGDGSRPPYLIGPYQTSTEVYKAFRNSGEKTVFCVAIRVGDAHLLEARGIPYGPPSESDFVEGPEEDPDEFVRAYVDREQLRGLIMRGTYPVEHLAVPERPAGYPEKISDSLAFLMEHSPQETFAVTCCYTDCPYDVVFRQGRQTFMAPAEEDRIYYEDWDGSSRSWEERTLTREEILALAEDPEIRSVFSEKGNHLYRTELRNGKPAAETEELSLCFRSREEWDADRSFRHWLCEFFGVTSDEERAEQDNLFSWESIWESNEPEAFYN